MEFSLGRNDDFLDASYWLNRTVLNVFLRMDSSYYVFILLQYKPFTMTLNYDELFNLLK